MIQAAFDAVLKRAGHPADDNARRLYLCKASEASLRVVNELAAKVLETGADFGQPAGTTRVRFDTEGDASCRIDAERAVWLWHELPSHPVRTTAALWELIELEALAL